jgi:hypothetical protein
MDAAEIYRQRAENAERAVRTDRYPSRWANSVGRPLALIASAIVQN